MALVELTKQLATQALTDTLVGKPAAPATSQPETACNTVLGQVHAMQKALKDDEELLVLFHTGHETVRVIEIFVPTQQVMVLKGLDAERNLTRVITPVHSVQLVCKVMKVQPPAKPTRVGIAVAKPKEGA